MAQQLINIGVTADDGTGDSIRLAGTKINDNFTEVYARPHLTLSHLQFTGNVIKSTQSNANIELRASGTGSVSITELTIDSTVNLSDNEIKVNTSNEDMVLTANGTGSIVMASADVNGGDIDATPIGSGTASSGAFTTLNTTSTASLDGIVISDNTITTTSNADLELTGAGTGTVSFNGIKFPTSDGTANQVLSTDGNGTLSYFTSPILFDVSDITDGTATITGDSSAQRIDSFDITEYRSANYIMSISDASANRFGMVMANVTHDGTNAYISTFGGVDNGTGDGSTVYDSLEFTAVINGGFVRVRGKVNNTNDQVIKFVRRIVKI